MRILLLIPGRLGERMSAPEIRGWNLALELQRDHEVSIAAAADSAWVGGRLPLISTERPHVVRAAMASDAVIGAPVAPYLFGALAAHPTLLIADLYNPASVEEACDRTGIAASITLAGIRAHEALQLTLADAVLCAVDAQRRQLKARIDALCGEVAARPLLRTVPFGVDNEPPPPSARHPIRERFPSIAEDDTIVLWWGNVWRWFDAETALRAFAILAVEEPKLKLVFTAGTPPRQEARGIDRTGSARQLAAALGLLGKSVHFVDQWVPHAERHDYLQEADIGLTLHRDTPEKQVAARGRYMDYLWARLPCVLAAGDELADLFGASGFAITVAPGDVAGTAAALRRLSRDPTLRAAARTAAEPLLRRFQWSAAVAPLLEVLKLLDGKPPLRLRARRRLLGRLMRVYAWRLATEVANRSEPVAVRLARGERRSPSAHPDAQRDHPPHGPSIGAAEQP